MQDFKSYDDLPDYESVSIQNCRYGNKRLNYWCECCARELRNKRRKTEHKKTLRDHRRGVDKRRDW